LFIFTISIPNLLLNNNIQNKLSLHILLNGTFVLQKFPNFLVLKSDTMLTYILISKEEIALPYDIMNDLSSITISSSDCLSLRNHLIKIVK